MKPNARAFFSCGNRKQRIKTPACNLEKEDGSLTPSDKEAAEVLHKLFASVFTDKHDKDALLLNQAAGNLYVGNPQSHLPALEIM